MAPLQTTAVVQSDGNIVIPVGRSDAGQQFVVRLTPIAKPPVAPKAAIEKLDRLIGAWSDFDFVDPSDPPPEKLEALD